MKLSEAVSSSDAPGDPSATSDAGAQESASNAAAEGALPPRGIPELEDSLGYSFNDKELVTNSLIHKSYLHDVPDYYLGSNERLEFLGDFVLGLIVSGELFAAHPDYSEGRLTALRGALVRKNTLAELAEPLDLGAYLYMSRGEEAAGGRTRPSNLARAVEAVLGAVYLDGGLSAAVDVWHRIMGDQSDEKLQAVLSRDYKSQLQQATQADLKLTPSYRLVDTTGPEHSKEFHVEVLAGDRVLGRGSGTNKQLAEQEAAHEALTELLASGDGVERADD